MIIARPGSADYEAIDAVVAAAFGRRDEAELVRSLRTSDSVLELIASDRGEAIGHVMYSRDWIETHGARHPAVQLAPLAVAPARQRSGIGGALIAEGFAQLRALGETHVFVLGHGDYYPRFGFSGRAAAPFQSPWPRPSFMLARIAPGGPDNGQLVAPAAFL